MTEYIFQPTIAQDGNSITIQNAPAGLVKQNILAIINKTTGGIVHSPLTDGITSLSYNGTTLTINLASGHDSIAGDLLVKVYSGDDSLGDLSDIIEAINGDTVDNIIDDYLDDEADQIEDIIGDWSENESESE